MKLRALAIGIGGRSLKMRREFRGRKTTLRSRHCKHVGHIFDTEKCRIEDAGNAAISLNFIISVAIPLHVTKRVSQDDGEKFNAIKT